MVLNKEECDISELIGKTLVKIERFEYPDEGGECVANPRHIKFTTNEGETFDMYHYQECCEDVYLDDIDGDLGDLLNTPITSASEESNSIELDGESEHYYDESFLWTFYKIGTSKGSVTLRWFGSSNGYYGEEVGIFKE